MSKKNNSTPYPYDKMEFQFLGKGNNGKVYLLSDGNVIKIFFRPKICKKEYYILEKVRGNKYYPKVYDYGDNYIIREFVDGTCLKYYIKQNGLSKKLCINIINLLLEFKRLKFTKQDIRCEDIFVKKDQSLMVIDPKGSYSEKRTFPQHLSKGLNKLEVLDTFMDVLKYENPYLYKIWSSNIYTYLRSRDSSE